APAPRGVGRGRSDSSCPRSRRRARPRCSWPGAGRGAAGRYGDRSSWIRGVGGRRKIHTMLVTRTYLELARPDAFRPAFGSFSEVHLERVLDPEPALYRTCYRTVGEAFHWRDRWDWTDADIRTHLADPNITLHVATRNGALAGWYELRRVPDEDSIEVAYF